MFTKKHVYKSFSVKPLTLAMISALLSSGAAQAEYSFSVPWYGNADMTPYSTNNFELGVGYSNSSGNTYRASQWNGLPATNSATGVANFNYSTLDSATGTNFNAIGRNLGLDSRRLAVDGGQQGVWQLSAAFDQIVHRNSNDGSFLHNGLGSDTLTLKPGFPPTSSTNANNINTYSDKGYGVKTDRQIFKLGGGYMFGGAWGMTADYRYDKRDGSNLIAAGIGSGSGGMRSTIIPYPVNDSTQQVDLGMNFATKDLLLNVGYYYSKYSNENSSLTWDNPFVVSGNTSGKGRLGLAPDNDFHQIKVDGAYNLTQKTRLTSQFQYGMARQNQDFLPTTINSAPITTLPTDSLNGKINTALFDVAFNSREIDKLNFKLKYQLKDKNNKTAQNQYRYVVGDTGTTKVVTNSVLSDREQKILADADYKFYRNNALRTWYQYTLNNMTPKGDQLRTQTNTDKYGIELRTRSFDMVTGKLQYTYEQRRGADYNKTGTASNLILRQYNIADYDQNKIKTMFDITPFDSLGLQLSADWAKREFKSENCDGFVGGVSRECRGLLSSDRQSYTADAQYALLPSVNLYSFYTYAQYKNDQSQYSNNATGRTAHAYTKNNDHTVGVGTNFKPKELPYEIGSQYVYNMGRGVTDTPDKANLANTTYRYQTVQTYAKWNYSKELTWGVEHQYQNMRANDWDYDNVNQWSTSNVITTGMSSGSYTQNYFGVSVRYAGF